MRGRTAWRTLGLTAALAAVAGACASSPPRPAPAAAEPAPDYARRVRDRILVARGEPHLLVRYNPAPCGCPPFEVLLDGTWYRVAFDVRDEEDPTVVALSEAARAEASGSVATWRLDGRLDDGLTTCGRGTIVVSVQPRALVP